MNDEVMVLEWARAMVLRKREEHSRAEISLKQFKSFLTNSKSWNFSYVSFGRMLRKVLAHFPKTRFLRTVDNRKAVSLKLSLKIIEATHSRQSLRTGIHRQFDPGTLNPLPSSSFLLVRLLASQMSCHWPLGAQSLSANLLY